MYRRLSMVMFPIAAVLFFGAIFWGYQEHQEKNAVLIKAENQYQRAFHDLNHHMNSLEDQLGQTIAVSSASQGMQRKGLVNVWRLTSQAQNEINQLPLAMLPFNKAEEFLGRLSSFAYRTSVRDLTKQPLTADEIKTLKTLHATAGSVNQQLGKVQDAVLADRLRWMDVEIAMAKTDSQHDNTIIDGFKAVDKELGAYPENDWGPTAMSADRKLSTAALPGKDMSKEEIQKKAADFLGTGAGGDIRVEETGQKTDFLTYSVSAGEGGGNDGNRVQLSYTKKGGQLLWFMNPRKVEGRKLDFNAAKDQAAQFLDSRGYKNMTPVTYDEYDHVAVFTFVQTLDGVRVYPDKVTVRVALDNGEAVGLQAKDHVFAQGESRLLTPGKPKITEDEARKRLNPEFKTGEHSLAIIENDMRQPVLCHEFVGAVGKREYRIYVNADTGLEENIERIPDASKRLYGVESA